MENDQDQRKIELHLARIGSRERVVNNRFGQLIPAKVTQLNHDLHIVSNFRRRTVTSATASIR